MSAWEYKVVPAPVRGVKAPGAKTGEARFANALEVLMNDMGAQGWEYQRAETLPSLERAGLTGSTTEWRNVLVFRRAVTTALDDFEPELLPAPTMPEKTAHAPDAPHAAPVARTEPQPSLQTAASHAEAGPVGDAVDTPEVTASPTALADQRNYAKSET